eukprot:TRINITY_DN12725_c0_g1_i1.p1 TRINITY_DN12725_c0_g1~~TRINITY_DN12725_c0_g1_i1.p1  ORF type:complete len:354 (-),score=53.77 TRINITY_DN12725_c0_g1_i1:31-1050(-)
MASTQIPAGIFNSRSARSRRKVPADAVQATNDDATTSKLSCVQLGYFQDDFVSHFVSDPQRRPPLIHRGYFARVCALAILRNQFLAATADMRRQIVVLGCGFDTTALHAIRRGDKLTSFYEVDFPEVIREKYNTIAAQKSIHSAVFGDEWPACANAETGEIHSTQYHTIGADLRNMDDVKAKLNLDPSVPTFVISECCLVYLQPEHSDAVLRYFGEFTTILFALYEQILPDDAFGRVMMSNLEKRGAPLYGVRAYPTMESQCQRFMRLGFTTANALDMDTIYYRALPITEISRIERLEIFDELEEWHMIQQHYSIAWAWRDLSPTPLLHAQNVGLIERK